VSVKLLGLLIAAFLVWTPSGLAQQFVDAPPVFNNAPGGSGGGAGAAAFIKDRYHQINSGMVNYGFSNHPYKQYTGYDGFSQGAGPQGLFTNIGYLSVRPMDFLGYLKGWAWGLEVLNFSSSTESVTASYDAGTVPSVDMTANLVSVNGRLYFADVSTSTLQPFIGLGWGVIQGEFAAITLYGARTRTTFIGPTTFQTFGSNVIIGPQLGMLLELRNATSNQVKTSNDPFNQNGGAAQVLDFTGTMLNMTGYYRF